MRLPLFNKRNKGFTLIEMLMAIAIMVIITSVVVLNSSKAGDGTTLKNNADLVSLTIRQAQVNSISVKELLPGSGSFSSGYGVEFTRSGSTYFSFYIDQNGNPIFNGALLLGTTNYLVNGVVVSDLCKIVSGVETCGLLSTDIAFLRPNTNARFYINRSSVSADAMEVKLSSPSGLVRTITTYSTGLISVK